MSKPEGLFTPTINVHGAKKRQLVFIPYCCVETFAGKNKLILDLFIDQNEVGMWTTSNREKKKSSCQVYRQKWCQDQSRSFKLSDGDSKVLIKFDRVQLELLDPHL